MFVRVEIDFVMYGFLMNIVFFFCVFLKVVVIVVMMGEEVFMVCVFCGGVFISRGLGVCEYDILFGCFEI